MEFFFAVFFLLFYYIRPQDWVPGLGGLNLIKPIIAVWIAVLYAGRSRASPLPGVLKTPHDWIILTYWIYVVWATPDSMAALTGFFPLVTFYALTVQSVNSLPRLLSYFKWWIIALTIVAFLANLIPLGIDLTGGQARTDRFFGRLTLGTWLHHNPNALAHAVVTVIPASYFLFFWRGTVLARFVAFPVVSGLAFWCVYQTQSKGAFLVGGILVASLFVIGRPKSVQIAAIAISMGLGVGALSFLPRMSGMNDIGSDEGVQGRLLAWDMARGVSRTHETGLGWQQFQALIDWKEGDKIIYDIPKATHSSYVQVGADLGAYGLFLYLAGLWCVLHTLLSFRPADETEDRCRRVLWILLLSNIISGWMINHQYHTEYFLLVASAAALHRLGKGREQGMAITEGSTSLDMESRHSQLEESMPEAEAPIGNPGVTPAFTNRVDNGGAPPKPLWNRFGLVDLWACICLTWLTFWLWDYILGNI